MKYLKVENNDSLVRDCETNAILNTDINAYNQYVMTYKNKPIISYKDRLEIVKSCKYVDEIYENADLIVTNRIIDKLKADYVVAGRENETYINKYYQIDKGKLHLINRTKNICSTDIKNKITLLT